MEILFFVSLVCGVVGVFFLVAAGSEEQWLGLIGAALVAMCILIAAGAHMIVHHPNGMG